MLEGGPGCGFDHHHPTWRAVDLCLPFDSPNVAPHGGDDRGPARRGLASLHPGVTFALDVLYFRSIGILPLVISTVGWRAIRDGC
jgi:hypothetical protein